jgi:hypothetical protein
VDGAVKAKLPVTRRSELFARAGAGEFLSSSVGDAGEPVIVDVFLVGILGLGYRFHASERFFLGIEAFGRLTADNDGPFLFTELMPALGLSSRREENLSYGYPV